MFMGIEFALLMFFNYFLFAFIFSFLLIFLFFNNINFL